MTSICGFLCAIGIFTFMGFVSVKTGVAIKDMPLMGPELAFVAYPAALTMLPLTNFWSVFFFITMILLGIDTHFGFLESIVGAIKDELLELDMKWKKFFNTTNLHLLFTILICFFGFLYAR